MKGALQLVKVAGIPVRVHWSFGLLLLWVVYASLSAGVGVAGTILSVTIVAIVFLCVVLHEYGHALTARRFGVNTRDIILSPIGGIARLEYIPDKPYQEILIAIAGPAVNFVIAAVLLLIAVLGTPYWVDLLSPQFWGWNYAQPVLIIVAKINIVLMIFNLTPAFPMDGGRVLRAALAIPLGRLRATIYAGVLGQLIAMSFLVAGVFELVTGQAVFVAGVRVSDLILSVIGIFIFLAARREIRNVRFKASMRTDTVATLLETQYQLISSSALVASTDIDVPEDGGVLLETGGNITGVLFTELYQHGKAENIVGATLGLYSSKLYEDMDVSQSLEEAIELFRSKGYRLCPVYQNGQIVGTLSRKAILNYLNI